MGPHYTSKADTSVRTVCVCVDCIYSQRVNLKAALSLKLPQTFLPDTETGTHTTQSLYSVSSSYITCLLPAIVQLVN